MPPTAAAVMGVAGVDNEEALGIIKADCGDGDNIVIVEGEGKNNGCCDGEGDEIGPDPESSKREGPITSLTTFPNSSLISPLSFFTCPMNGSTNSLDFSLGGGHTPSSRKMDPDSDARGRNRDKTGGDDGAKEETEEL